MGFKLGHKPMDERVYLSFSKKGEAPRGLPRGASPFFRI